MDVAQRMARNMVWGRPMPQGGRIVEAGVWSYAWLTAPKVASWLGQLGLVIGLSQVAGWISGSSSTKAGSEALILPNTRAMYQAVLEKWYNFAKLRIDPSRLPFIAPLYARAVQMSNESGLTLAKMSSLIGAFSEHVQGQAAAAPHPDSVVDFGTTDLGDLDDALAAMATKPAGVLPAGAWVPPDPVLGSLKPTPSVLGWIMLGVGLWAGWRAWRG